MILNVMRAILTESQEDAMEWHPIFEFRIFEQERKDEEKNNPEEVQHFNVHHKIHQRFSKF